MSKELIEVQAEDSGSRLDLFLVKHCHKARTFIQELIKAGSVTLNNSVTQKPSLKLKTGDQISIELSEVKDPLAIVPVQGNLSILFEDEYLLVINKAQGVVVHPAAGHRGDTLVHHLMHHWKESPFSGSNDNLRPGIVHRLDKGTSGVLLVAKNREIQEALASQFKERTVQKSYECVVWGQVSRPGKLTSSIGRDKRHRHKMSSQTHQGRQSETSFSPCQVFEDFTHLNVFPKTGRTHQIRVHLSEWGHPIVCDPLYSKGLTPKKKQALSVEMASFLSTVSYPFLHAKSLSFSHPVSKKTLEFSAPLPPDFARFLKLLGGKGA